LPPAAPPAAPAAPAARPTPIPDAVSTLATPVRVGLLVDSASFEIGADGRFVVQTADGREVARLDGGETARFASSGGGVTLTANGRTQQLSAPLTVQAPGEGILRVRNNPYRGVLLVQRGTRGLTLVNRLDMESYLLGVVPREIGRVGPELLEASKAQAVAARPYAVRDLGPRSAQGVDVFAPVEDQVYGGVAAEHAPGSRAVLETVGEILEYHGRPIDAYYHSTCAGRTAAIDEVWNERPVPYLISVTDVNPATGEAFDRSSSRFQWTERWTGPQMVEVLNRTLADSLRGRRITQVRDMRVTARTPSGRVRAMNIETDAGRFTVGKDRVRWILTPMRGGILNSSKFEPRVSSDGSVVIEGGGWGHGIGMCQVGAMGRARAGQDYRAILSTYYPGTTLRKVY
ncbi:MAG: SpoIID/LytB domain-containing protein, partial [Gemmatimonadetes bacterium]|nr:SpoIID/LytB domain-containing protein [Gemmatimonadota bacterium]